MSSEPKAAHPAAPIEFTEAAARAILARAEREGFPGGPVRVRIKGGGCSGVTYVMTFEDGEPREGDFVRSEPGAWAHRRFAGTRWSRVRSPDGRRFLENSYRVLMSRAREGLIIWVPTGSPGDPTRRSPCRARACS